jgi:hypothetical protein
MGRIFIGYRREDTAGHAGRLRDNLMLRFGREEVFRDIEHIAPGADFVEVLSQAIDQCRVFLAVIGNQWLTTVDERGQRRLDDPEDHVRRELAEALSRGVRVIPVLVEGAVMPRASELPPEVAALATRNAVMLSDDSWEDDVERLSEAIRTELGRAGGTVRPPATTAPDRPATAQRKHRHIAWVAGVAGAVAIAAIAVVALVDGGDGDDPAAAATGSLPNVPEAEPDESSQPAPPPPAEGREVTLLSGGEAEVGKIVYQLLGARLLPGGERDILSVRVRVTNHTRSNTFASGSAFRVAAGDEVHASTTSFSEIIAARTATDGELRFPVPHGARGAIVVIEEGNERAEVRLDLSAGAGVTAQEDRRRRADGAAAVVPQFDAARATVTLGDERFQLLRPSGRRYVNKTVITLPVRVMTAGSAILVSHDNFRLFVDDLPRAPVFGFSEVVPATAAFDAEVVFDVPPEVSSVTLRIMHADQHADIPVRLR